jgi:hypothetical protein
MPLPGPRVLMQPALFNQASPATANLFPTYSAPGIDAVGAGGTNFATAWGTNYGVMIPNQGNGAVWLYFLCGGTAAGITQVLVGDLVGATGQVLPATTYQYTIALSTSGWLGPFSPATFNQQAPTQVTYAGALNSQALTAQAQGCIVIDFTLPTTLCVRAYQNVTVSP